MSQPIPSRTQESPPQCSHSATFLNMFANQCEKVFIPCEVYCRDRSNKEEVNRVDYFMKTCIRECRIFQASAPS
jgi:hypothetical protein